MSVPRIPAALLRWWVSSSLVLAGLAATERSAWAVTTGELEVQVVDDEGFEVPNADVTPSGPHLLGGRQTARTDAMGVVRFANLHHRVAIQANQRVRTGLNGEYAQRIRHRGTYTTLPSIWDLSGRVQQSIPVRGAGDVRLSFEARNLTDNRAGGRYDAARLTGGQTLDANNRLSPVERQNPLRLQIGARYDF
jgi:hypothetical protein